MGMLDGLLGSALGGMMGTGASGSAQAQSPLLQIALLSIAALFWPATRCWVEAQG